MSNHPNPYTAPHRQHAATAVTGERAAQVLKNTYMLLGLSLMVATGAAVFAMAMGIGYVNVFVTLGVYFGLLFATNKLRNSSWGILAVFGLTGQVAGNDFGEIDRQGYRQLAGIEGYDGNRQGAVDTLGDFDGQRCVGGTDRQQNGEGEGEPQGGDETFAEWESGS